MFLEERRNKILAYLTKHERASVDYLATAFAVSKETIRSDLNEFVRLNLVQRCYGGAIIVRRSLQSELIAPRSKNFEVLLKRLEKQTLHQTSKQKGNKMNGKVCILGSFNVDIVAKVARFPKGCESIIAQGSALGPGGKEANQAMAASRGGSQVYFVTKVGTDQFSQFAYDHLSSSDIHAFKLYQSDTEPTGNSIIYVSQQNGENMIAIYPGANQTITDDEVAAIAPELTTSDVLLVQLENNFSVTLNVIKLAHALGKKVILNPAPYPSEILPYLDYLDVITPNETEASLLSGIDIQDFDSTKEAALKIARMGAKRVIITMGSRGVLLYDGHQSQHIPALGVDTTGAGDAFNGAFAAALANGQSMVQAATYASAFASLAVEREGASNMREHQQVIARLSQR
ncbi:PfkB family carbohydrate kinase [Candidatus Symbiopectobacterium sp.]|uniref:PfkB family carbohydrate kinase n=1 Tax=Candidatus Symbiopectobacterium sp. TaxID=2816440 RepID=UPI0025C42FB7|nr:PfkB family carbohydrate kinase [Candidatus Symbiopectobacterium sp.]